MTLTTEKAVGIMSTAFSEKGENMKKYLILSDTLADNKKVKAGDVVELTDEEGNTISFNQSGYITSDGTYCIQSDLSNM